MYRVKDLYDKHQTTLGLHIVAGLKGLDNRIYVPEVHRPGLALTGYLNNQVKRRMLVFGKVEVEYLNQLGHEVCCDRIEKLLGLRIPAVIYSKRNRPHPLMLEACERNNVPLIRTDVTTMKLLEKLMFILTDEFAPTLHCHGTFVEVFGVGVLIQGDSGAGKSEAALGLVERGHRLVSDDVVKIRKREDSYLEGSGVDELMRYHMEIRGIGIINVAHLYGAVCVCDVKKIDMVVRLEAWDDNRFYDRIGIEDNYCEILGLQLPYHIVPVKPGRDVVLLIETLALNRRLKTMGYHSAQEFSAHLLEKIKSKPQKGRRICNVRVK